MNHEVILLKELIILPGQEVKVDLISEVSKNVIKKSIDLNEGKVLVVAPLDQKESNPNVDDLPKIGVIAHIKNKIELPNSNTRVILKGLERVVVQKYFYDNKEKSNLIAATTVITLPKFDTKVESALLKKLKESIKKWVKMNDNSSNTILAKIEKATDLNKTSDIIASFLPFNISKKLEYMQQINPVDRSKNLLEDIEEEIEILKIEEEIEESIRKKLLEKEKKYYLKEKLDEIKIELGETSIKDEEVKSFEVKLNNLKVSEKTKDKLKKEIEKLSFTSEESPEASVLKNYIDTVINLPWSFETKDTTSTIEIKKHLENSHYGLSEVKERIYEYAELKTISKNIKTPIICLVGPPGVGKTSIAKSIAKALNREFYKISVGGLSDSTELIGSRRTYLGANPGKIIQGIKRCKAKNPVILIDEVDKMVKNYKGDPASTLLEILDESQNSMFIDNYIEEEFDLSKVLFILTANEYENIPYALLDRLEIMKINSYTFYEKVNIAKKYILPKIFDEYDLKNAKISITNDVLINIINNYTKEAGVRNLDNTLKKLVRKALINNEKSITAKSLKTYLGNAKYESCGIELINQIGTINLLAYTQLGGILTKVEVIKNKGQGNVVITGMVGQVMDESIKVALTYLKSNYKVDFSKNDIHLHFLEAATKKDGPSAGVSITTALLSLSLGKEVDSRTAFTGELTLSGKIMKVGGIKEKVIAAINNKINVLYLPFENSFDIVEVPEKYLSEIKIKFVKNYEEIYSDLFS